MTIKELQTICHSQATDKGFWESKPCVCLKVAGMLNFTRTGKPIDDCQACKGTGIVKAERNLGEILMLIVSELSEALEALRKNKRQNISKDWKKDTFEDELADTAIRLFDLAEAEGIDLTYQIEQKLKYNKTRPTKHGKLF